MSAEEFVDTSESSGPLVYGASSPEADSYAREHLHIDPALTMLSGDALHDTVEYFSHGTPIALCATYPRRTGNLGSPSAFDPVQLTDSGMAAVAWIVSRFYDRPEGTVFSRALLDLATDQKPASAMSSMSALVDGTEHPGRGLVLPEIGFFEVDLPNCHIALAGPPQLLAHGVRTIDDDELRGYPKAPFEVRDAT